MLVDMLRFVAMADQLQGLPFSRQHNGLNTATDIVTPIDPAVGVGQWKHIKDNSQGWPWDIKLYDQHYIYDWVTTNDDIPSPRNFKKFIQNHSTGTTGKFADGLVMFPRFPNSVSLNNAYDKDFLPAFTKYATFTNCNQTNIQSLGTVHQSLRGPFRINSGGSVGEQLTMIHQYYWIDTSGGANVPIMEENHYVLNFGWVAWKLHHLNTNTGFYELVKETINNILVPAIPQIDFPCF